MNAPRAPLSTATFMTGRPWLSIIMPVLNEAQVLPDVLARLQPWRQAGVEIILADGGSEDASRNIAKGMVDRWLDSPAGRARQMNTGVACAKAPALLFLHADTELPADALPALRDLLAQAQDVPVWGRFDVDVKGRSPWLPMIAFMINLRSRFSGISTGDQALFVTKMLFQAVGGFPDQPLMEDVEISRRLRKVHPPHNLTLKVKTSGRRWDANGAWPTILLMWKLRWLYWRGASPQKLADMYRNSRRQ